MSKKTADLTPPLGYPGGPCHLVQRIHDEVKNPRVRDYLTDRVEEGQSLDKSDERMLYDIETEKGPGGPISKILITPHAQHRMDLRGVTVPEVRLALKAFLKQLNDWKSRGSWEYDAITKDLLHGKVIDWLDPKTQLFVAFRTEGRGQAMIVTTYWKGQPDPKPPGSCSVKASDVTPGVKTFVSPWAEKGLPGRENKSPQALPVSEGARETHLPGARFNTPVTTPGEDRSVVDKARTKPIPGEQYGHPVVDSTVTLKRRAETDPGFPHPRQREQHGDAKKYHQKHYRNNRSQIQQRAKKRYKRERNTSDFRLNLERRRENPEKFERYPSGGYSSNAERSKEYRERKAMADLDRLAQMDEREAYTVRNSPAHRQRAQRGQARLKSKIYYMRNRNKSKQKARQRYKQLRNNPSFKRQQQIRRKNPQRFQRRHALDLSQISDVMAVTFVMGPEMLLGQVVALAPESKVVTFVLYQDPEGITTPTTYTLPLCDFMDAVVFLTYDDINAMYDMIDEVVGLGAYDENFDPELDRSASFYMKVDSPIVELREVEEGNPTGKPLYRREPLLSPEYLSKKANIWRTLDKQVRTLLLNLVRSPMWREYAIGIRSDEDVTEWFQARGVQLDQKEWRELLHKLDPSGGTPSIKVAVKLADLESGVDQKIKDKARGIRSKLKRVDQKNGIWLFEVQGSEGAYRVSVKAQAKKGRVSNSDILVACSCPFWRWQGPEYHAKQGGYLYGVPVGTASKPEQMDPSNTHLVCKHALAVLARMQEVSIRRKQGGQEMSPLVRKVAAVHLASHLGPREAEEVLSVTLGGKPLSEHVRDYLRQVLVEGQRIHNLVEQARKKVEGYYPPDEIPSAILRKALLDLIVHDPWGRDAMAPLWAEAFTTGEFLF